MIIFKKIRFKNFLSFGNTFTEVVLDSHNKTLIYGSNGHGKSSILCALTYVLFNKPFRKVNKPNLCNSINKKDCVVEIEFSIGNREYKIVRGMKPNVFEIYQDGLLLEQDAATKDYQDYLENNILKTNYKSFTQVVILGSARYTPFMQLSSADRRAVIEDLLDIQIFSTMNVIIKDKLNQLKTDLSNINHNIELSKIQINNKNAIIKENKKKSESQISVKKEEILKYETEIERIQSDISLIETHIKVLSVKIQNKDQFEVKKKKLISFESKLEENLKNINKDLKFYIENDSCPTCRQNIDEGFKGLKISSANEKKEKLTEGSEKLSLEIIELENKLKDMSDVISHITEHVSEISSLNATITSYKTFIKKLNAEIETLSDLNSDSTSHIDELREMVFEYEKTVDVKNKMIEDKKYLEYCATMLKDGGIKTKIIKKYLPILNKLINKYLLKLDFFVNFNINENFEEVIKSRHRDEFQYNNFSEGEKLKIDISLLMAFREISKMKNNICSNFLILDEVIDSSLDEVATDLFLELLDSIEGNIIMISPKGENFNDRFDRVIKVEKVKNFSKIKHA